jgi:hypothetical protein
VAGGEPRVYLLKVCCITCGQNIYLVERGKSRRIWITLLVLIQAGEKLGTTDDEGKKEGKIPL